jgi:ABC-2 type transport system permease protein
MQRRARSRSRWRYLRLLAVELRVSASTAMQYRADFAIEGALALAWALVGLIPLAIAFRGRPPVAGWTFHEALVVVGCFTVLKAVLDGAVNPSLALVVEQIRAGTLDFVLIKPADAQFLVSTAKFQPWRVVDVLTALAIFAFAFHGLGRAPPPSGVAMAAALLVTASIVLYSMWILVIAMAFWVVRLDNLSYFFNALFDFGRWPISIFQGVWRFVFTFVVPLAVMTTYPAEALLGRLGTATALASFAGALVFAAVARLVWLRALSRYTSASS